MKPPALCSLVLLLAIVLLAVALGCGGSDRPDLAEVEGTVTLDGAPLPGARIEFKPAQGKISSATTGENGHYELVYLRDIKGAVPGKHTVTITTASEHQPGERLPPRYNRETELTAEVKPGETNEIPFALESQ
jgi:hypothetical protein